MMEADQSELKARSRCKRPCSRRCRPKKAARYLQLESKIRAFQDYDLAVVIPLVK